jgi:pimeloyl-ACP methyl ester carboxylesterase
MPIASLPARLNPAKIDVKEALLKLDQLPIAVLHGDRDDLVVTSEAERNMEALPSTARITWFAGCGHTEGRWLLPDQYWTAINQLIEKALERSHYRS